MPFPAETDGTVNLVKINKGEAGRTSKTLKIVYILGFV